MILTITLNPAIDSRYHIKDFQIDKVIRCTEYEKTAGGKGLNVSRILKSLRKDVLATGFIGGKIGEYFLELLEKDEIKENFIRISEETRTCLALLGDDGTQTEILEIGPTINQIEIEKFIEIYEKQLQKVELVCVSGSLPQGINTDFYKCLSQKAKKSQIPFIMDTSGEAFREGIKGKPYLIKPNKEELENYCGKTLDTEIEIIKVIKELLDKGIKYVAVSLGKEGAILASKKQILKATPPNIKALNPVGSGDSMIGGFAKAIADKKTDIEILKYGIACGTANAMEAKTGQIELSNVESILKKIKIESI